MPTRPTRRQQRRENRTSESRPEAARVSIESIGIGHITVAPTPDPKPEPFAAPTPFRRRWHDARGRITNLSRAHDRPLRRTNPPSDNSSPKDGTLDPTAHSQPPLPSFWQRWWTLGVLSWLPQHERYAFKWQNVYRAFPLLTWETKVILFVIVVGCGYAICNVVQFLLSQIVRPVAAQEDCSIVYVTIPGPVMTVSLLNPPQTDPAHGTYYYSVVDGTTQWLGSQVPPSRRPTITLSSPPGLQAPSTATRATITISQTTSLMVSSSSSTTSVVPTPNPVTSLITIVPGAPPPLSNSATGPGRPPPPSSIVITISTSSVLSSGSGATTSSTSLSPPPVPSDRPFPPAPSTPVRSSLTLSQTATVVVPSSSSASSAVQIPDSSSPVTTSTGPIFLTSTMSGSFDSSVTNSTPGPSSPTLTTSLGSSIPGSRQSLTTPPIGITTSLLRGSSSSVQITSTVTAPPTSTSLLGPSTLTTLLTDSIMSTQTVRPPLDSLATTSSSLSTSAGLTASSAVTLPLSSGLPSSASASMPISSAPFTTSTSPTFLTNSIASTTTNNFLPSISSTSARSATTQISSSSKMGTTPTNSQAPSTSASSVASSFPPSSSSISFSSRLGPSFPGSSPSVTRPTVSPTLSSLSSLLSSELVSTTSLPFVTSPSGSTSRTVVTSTSTAPQVVTTSSMWANITYTTNFTITSTFSSVSTFMSATFVSSMPSGLPSSGWNMSTSSVDYCSGLAASTGCVSPQIATKVLSYGNTQLTFVFPSPSITTTVSYWTGTYPTITGAEATEFQGLAYTTQTERLEVGNLALPTFKLFQNTPSSLKTLIRPMIRDIPSPTGTGSLPSASTPCGENGLFTLTFDDVSTGSESDGLLPVSSVTNPYHHLFYANGFVYMPDKWQPYPAISQPNVAMFLPIGASLLPSRPFAGTLPKGGIGAGPRMSVDAYWFNAHSGYFGCALNGLTNCVLRVSGYRYDTSLAKQVVFVEQNVTIPACWGYINCRLTEVIFGDGFKQLSGIQFEARTEKLGIPQVFMMDSLQLEWWNTTCEAGILRIGHR